MKTDKDLVTGEAIEEEKEMTDISQISITLTLVFLNRIRV